MSETTNELERFGSPQILVEVPSVLKDPEANATLASVVGSLFKSNWQDHLSK